MSKQLATMVVALQARKNIKMTTKMTTVAAMRPNRSPFTSISTTTLLWSYGRHMYVKPGATTRTTPLPILDVVIVGTIVLAVALTNASYSAPNVPHFSSPPSWPPS